MLLVTVARVAAAVIGPADGYTVRVAAVVIDPAVGYGEGTGWTTRPGITEAATGEVAAGSFCTNEADCMTGAGCAATDAGCITGCVIVRTTVAGGTAGAS
mmetsp:Transcript_32637/g.58956  ORF Transcript_32637/g.58956 Transcript_32637/m.58956 type:complete len:100 (+) Transcript_32637:143-442(+)